MINVIITGIVKLVEGWFKLKTTKQEAAAKHAMRQLEGEIEWDLEAMRASAFSWKDELITLIWFSPLYVGWFEKRPNELGEEEWFMRDATEWVDFVGNLPMWWQIGAFGIIAASFGLRWYFKDKEVLKK